MLIAYMHVSSESDRQTTDLQRDALLGVGVDERHLFQDHLSGARDDRPGLKKSFRFFERRGCFSRLEARSFGSILSSSSSDHYPFTRT